MVYIDVTDPRINDFPAVKKYVEDEGTPLPIVAFGDEPRWAGFVSLPLVMQELSKEGYEQVS